jgi:hypothetical protein
LLFADNSKPSNPLPVDNVVYQSVPSRLYLAMHGLRYCGIELPTPWNIIGIDTRARLPQARKQLLVANRDTFDTIEQALFSVVLDDNAPSSYEQVYQSACSQLFGIERAIKHASTV